MEADSEPWSQSSTSAAALVTSTRPAAGRLQHTMRMPTSQLQQLQLPATLANDARSISRLGAAGAPRLPADDWVQRFKRLGAVLRNLAARRLALGWCEQCQFGLENKLVH